MTGRSQLLLGALFFALLFVYAGARIYRAYVLYGLSDPGFMLVQQGNRSLIDNVRRPGPASDLRPGDEVIEINGQQLRGNTSQIASLVQRVPPDEGYTMRIMRNGQFLQLALRTEPIPLRDLVLVQGAYVVIPTIFLITGFAVFLLKPFDKQAMLLALMFGMFIGVPSALIPTFVDVPWWLVGVVLVAQLSSLFFWPVFCHFFLIFPDPSPVVRRVPRSELYLYLPHLLLVFPYFATVNVLAALWPAKLAGFRASFSWVGSISNVLFVAYIAGGLMALLVNYRQAGRVARRKMRVIVAGSVAGFLPTFLWIGLAFVFDLSRFNPTLAQALFFIAVFAFPLFPLSFAYAIVRHQVIPVRLMLRRSVRYLLISRGFIIIQAIVVFAVLSFLLTGSRMAAIDQLGSRADIVVTMVATVAAIVLLAIVNQRVLPIIDRRFFREAYDAQQLLSDLGMEMRTVATVGQLLELTVAKIQDALHIENVTIFLRDEATGDYRCVISSRIAEDGLSTSDPDRGQVLPCSGEIVEKLIQTTQPLLVEMETPRNWGQATFSPEEKLSEPKRRERAALRRINSALLLPVATKDELLGVISLGQRLGDLPFSREDRQMLMAVAWQMAFAIQNADLVQLLAEEERLRRELEIATAVQQRLFPQRSPEVGRLELSGVCHPARGVGGDYYDFILLEQGKVGIAVADVAGKGMSAALLMSTVQASLRSQASSVNGNLIELVSRMNRLLHHSTDSNSYATFFYAQYDSETGTLTYVNAGHNPPILVRAESAIKAQSAGQTVTGSRDLRTVAGVEAEASPPPVNLLTTGGPVIGAFHGSCYEQETVQLNSGDMLVAYTDGVTEALNAEGEEFGEPRLSRLVASSLHMTAEDLMERIVESVREWCRDVPQHDDLTLVVIKVK